MSDMSAFRTPPQAEFRAEQELREAGFSAFVPTEYRYRRSGASRTRRTKIRVPMCPGYVFGSGKPSEARHVRNRIGTLRSDETKHLQEISGKEVDPTPAPITWATGDAAIVTGGVMVGAAVTVLEVSKKFAIVKGFWFNAERECGVYVKHLKPPDAT